MMKAFDTTTIGERELCAWATSEIHCRIQTTDPQLARAIQRLPDCERVGFSVAGGFLRLFSMRRTLPWVRQNVINQKGAWTLKKNTRNLARNAQPSVLVAGGDRHTAGLAPEPAKRE